MRLACLMAPCALVTSIADGQIMFSSQAPGCLCPWAKRTASRRKPSGAYFSRLEMGQRVQVRKLVLIK